MNDLKEYSIVVSKMGDEIVKWSGGEFIVRNIFDEKERKYGIPKLLKGGGTTKAYTQSLKINVGDKVTVAVDEEQKKNKDGQEYIARTIRFIKGDEHGTPYTTPSAPKDPVKGQIEASGGVLVEGLNDKQKLDILWNVHEQNKDMNSEDPF